MDYYCKRKLDNMKAVNLEELYIFGKDYYSNLSEQEEGFLHGVMNNNTRAENFCYECNEEVHVKISSSYIPSFEDCCNVIPCKCYHKYRIWSGPTFDKETQTIVYKDHIICEECNVGND